MLRRLQKLLRLDRLERRLFGWLLLLTLVPLLTLLGVGYGLGARALQWVGTLGPWEQVAESGRALVEAAAPAAAADPELAQALETHRLELSNSVTLARRWSFLGERLASALPFLALTLAMLLAALALWVGRRLSVQLARPIRELAGWADSMAVGEPLPPPQPAEAREVREVRALRDALRLAAVRIAEARARALEAERVRAWGEMARRVAHEMKNPLTPLRLAAHRLGRHPEAGTTLREPREVIEEEVARLDELARQFAVLGRPSAGPASDVDLRELLERLLESDVPPHIATRLRYAPDVPLIHAHYDALQRAFRNLIRNAVEAMQPPPARGDAPATTPAAAGDRGAQPQLSIDVRMRPGEVSIILADTGRGIPLQHLDRLFEPDFTLKAGGTGLGLAVVRQAVAAHGGSVAAAPRAGGGAEFTVRLPTGRAP
jgi:two-component system, NtrC family, nitrogen regulation sensor histidine kinase NtrY